MLANIMDFDIYKEIGLNVIRILGKGSYATVYYCTKQSTGQPFAVKVIILSMLDIP